VFSPPTLFVVVSPGTELLDKEDQFLPIKVITPWMLAITVPVDRVIQELLWYEEAIPQGLTTLEAPFRRYMVTAPITRSVIRIPKEWVEQLLPAHDRLVCELSQGFHPDLAALIAEHDGTVIEAQAGWDAMNQEQKRAVWDAMGVQTRREKAAELVKRHGGNKTAAGREVGISGIRIGQLLKLLKVAEVRPEAPLPVNKWTQAAGLATSTRSKAPQ